MNTRDRLAEALRAHRVRSVVLGDGECACGWFGSPFSQHQTDALLPVVDAIAAERAAEELLAAAEELHVQRFNDNRDPARRWPPGAPKAPDSFYAGIVRARVALRSRAAGLTDKDSQR